MKTSKKSVTINLTNMSDAGRNASFNFIRLLLGY
jgi:hypothetical protein